MRPLYPQPQRTGALASPTHPSRPRFGLNFQASVLEMLTDIGPALYTVLHPHTASLVQLVNLPYISL